MRTLFAAALAALAAACTTLTAEDMAPADIARTVNPAMTVPIATSVRVPAGHDLVFISGMIPATADPSAPPGTRAAYGDTRTQTLSVLARLGAALEAEGLTFADVVVARVFLVGDPELGGRMDFAGLNQAFGQFFGSAEQPNRPARTVVQVVALPAPGAMVEIDFIAAARPR